MRYKVMHRAHGQVWYTACFLNEAEARKFANQCYKTGSADIEIYRKSRTGYILVDAVHLTKNQAIEHFASWVAEDAPCFN